MKTFIIDALNVIHKNNELKSLGAKSKEMATGALCSMISNYLRKYPSYKAIVVVDGKLDEINKFHQNITIIESQNNTADDKIKKIIAESTKKSFLVVISSDNEVYNYARINAVTAQQSEDFLNLISQNEPKISKSSGNLKSSKNNPQKPARASKKEIEEFKNLFNSSTGLI